MIARSTRAHRLARSRRAFLKTVGRSAAALPFYRLLESSAVYGAAGDQPLRFIGLYAPHGVCAPFYNRRPTETETSFSLTFENSVLSPFDDPATHGVSFKDRVTLVEGIDLAAGIETNTNGHDAACVILTGSGPMGGKPQNESIDQFLAVSRGLGAATRYASVALGVGTKRTESGFNLSYAKGGAPLPKIINPAETYSMLFANLVVGDDATAQAAFERKRLLGMSVLDFLRKDIARLQTRLAATEKIKLEHHLTSLRELEKQIETLPAGSAACAVPAKPNPAEFPKLEIFNGGEPYLEKIADIQIDLLAQAMACDLTRFATLFIGMTEDVHNSVAHAYNGPKGQYEPGNPATWPSLANQNRLYFRKCARLMQRLASFGVLDSSLIFMSSDLGDPSLHSLRNVPVVLAGGLNGAIKMGRRMVVAADCPAANFYCMPQNLTSNNKLLVSIAQAFGLSDVTSFGTAVAPGITDGALPDLLT